MVVGPEAAEQVVVAREVVGQMVVVQEVVGPATADSEEVSHSQVCPRAAAVEVAESPQAADLDVVFYPMAGSSFAPYLRLVGTYSVRCALDEGSRDTTGFNV